MESKDKYVIALSKLPLGTQTYSYRLDDAFFEFVDGPEIRKGNVSVDISLRKSAKSFELRFHSKGYVMIPCNRCMEDMKQEIETENELIVKFGDKHEEVDDTLVVVPEYPGEIDLSWYLYEFIALSIPIRHVHEKGGCSEMMEEQLMRYMTEERMDDDDETETESKGTDPRWDALRSLLNKETEL